MKQILDIRSAPAGHWVGNGFPVRSLFSYSTTGFEVSPFLLLDYAGPTRFPGDGSKRGVGEHPHRGFETVTIVYNGEVEHRDSAGGGGVIGAGDVQWMTAGAGLLHEEFHSADFSARGGELEMVQLWVNLPAKDKLTEPGYQAIKAASIPVVELPDGAGCTRVIAGSFAGHSGAARTFSPLDVWDLRLRAGHRTELPAAKGRSLMVVILAGTVTVNDTETLSVAQLAGFDTAGEGFVLEAGTDAKVLVLGGQPLNEPVVGHGPFVMNSQQEIHTAINDFNSGRFGRRSRRA